MTAPTPPVNMRWLGRAVPTRRRCRHRRAAGRSRRVAQLVAVRIAVVVSHAAVLTLGKAPLWSTDHHVGEVPARYQQVDLVLGLPHRATHGQVTPWPDTGRVEQPDVVLLPVPAGLVAQRVLTALPARPGVAQPRQPLRQIVAGLLATG